MAKRYAEKVMNEDDEHKRDDTTIILPSSLEIRSPLPCRTRVSSSIRLNDGSNKNELQRMKRCGKENDCFHVAVT